MNPFDVAQSFIEKCRAGVPAGQLVVPFQRAVEMLGFRYFACCSHVDPLRPPWRAVVLHNYPQEWARAFSELEFFEIDPVFHRASRTLLPFHWDAPDFRADLTPPQQEILLEAERYGIAHGYTIPIHSPDPVMDFRASCSVVPDSRKLDPFNYSVVQLMVFHIYEVARAQVGANPGEPRLSRRERQCLELSAQGKSSWAAGKLLGISEATVRNHVERARRRLQVATRAQAIVRALASGQISFGDVLRAQPATRNSKARTRGGRLQRAGNHPHRSD